MIERPIDFSKLFHQSSKDHLGGGVVAISHDSTEWPDSWKTTYYKKYGKLPQVALPVPAGLSAPLFDLVAKRKSVRDFAKNPISLSELATFLKYSCGEIRGGESRAQASAGARFPIEAYILVLQATEGLPCGVYHYNVKEHSLDVLLRKDFSPEDIQKLFTYAWAQDAAISMVLTGVFARMQEKYGERGYRYVLLEAGHVGQNAYLVSEALNIGCCALGGVYDEALEKLLDIDGVGESVIYGFVLGKTKEASG